MMRQKPLQHSRGSMKKQHSAQLEVFWLSEFEHLHLFTTSPFQGGGRGGWPFLTTETVHFWPRSNRN